MYGMTLVTQSETTREAIASILNNQIAKQSIVEVKSRFVADDFLTTRNSIRLKCELYQT